jgi:hypothetical protein
MTPRLRLAAASLVLVIACGGTEPSDSGGRLERGGDQRGRRDQRGGHERHVDGTGDDDVGAGGYGLGGVDER